MEVGHLTADPYAVTDEGIYFDLHDNNQLSWPKAHKASIFLDKCKQFDFFIVKDSPLVPTLSTTSDCAVDWKVVDCKPKLSHGHCEDDDTGNGCCTCAELKGATCVGCLKTYQVAVHAPAY